MPVFTPAPVLRRNRAIRLTVGASIGAKVFSVACTFAQVPLALRYLGTETYGFWITITGIVLILNTIDFGVGVGLQHAMASAFGRDDMPQVRRLFWTGTTLLGLLGLAILAVGLTSIFKLSWADMLKISDPALRGETRPALAVALSAFVVGLPMNAVNRLAAAVQRGWLNSGWVAVGSGLSLGLVALAGFGHWGFLWFLGSSLLVPALQGLGLMLHLGWSLGWALVPSRLASWPETRLIIRRSLWYALPQAGQVLVQSAPSLALSLAAGPLAVTAYSLLQRVYGLLQQCQVLWLTPVWPAYTEAAERGDREWIRRTYARTILGWAGLAVAASAIGWKSHSLLHWWVGDAASLVSSRLAGVVGAWCVLQMAAQPPSYFLMGIGRLRELAWAATPGLFLAVGALFWATRTQSAVSVLAAGCWTFAVVALPPVLLTTWRLLQGERIATGE